MPNDQDIWPGAFNLEPHTARATAGKGIPQPRHPTGRRVASLIVGAVFWGTVVTVGVALLVALTARLLDWLRDKNSPEAVRGTFESLLAKARTEGTAERVVPHGSGWHKRKLTAAELKYDVRKTDSLVSPYAATTKWFSREYVSNDVATKNAADKLVLPQEPIDFHLGVDVPALAEWQATFAFQEGQWIVKDVGYRPVAGDWKSRSDYPPEPDCIWDWWWAFGGR